VAALVARGVPATQSSVSRDLRALSVAKVGGRYVLPSAAHEPLAVDPSSRLAEVARFIHSVQRAGPNLLVLHTSAGAAQGVGFAIDAAGWTEIVGTVAGDDTLFLATGGAAGQRRLMARLASLVRSVRQEETPATDPPSRSEAALLSMRARSALPRRLGALR
jgi:transcriptional regulator of arginine metabolism